MLELCLAQSDMGFLCCLLFAKEVWDYMPPYNAGTEMRHAEQAWLNTFFSGLKRSDTMVTARYGLLCFCPS